MLPMKHSSIFKSRWMALLWAAGFVWLAYDVASSAPKGDNDSVNTEQPTDVTGAPISESDAKKVAEALNKL